MDNVNVELPLIGGENIILNPSQYDCVSITEKSKIAFEFVFPKYPLLKISSRKYTSVILKNKNTLFRQVYNLNYSLRETCEALGIEFKSKEEIKMNSTLKYGSEEN